MEKGNGSYNFMEERVHSGSIRQKSKVPRARLSQRSDYVEYSTHEIRNGSLRNVCSPRDALPHSMSYSSHAQGDTDEYKEWQKLLGDRVCISGVKQGVLRYFGRTNFAQGYWCGVELDEPVGKNNGTVNGVVYFNCKPNHGIFAPVSKVSKLNDLSSCEWRVDPNRDLSFSSNPQDLQQSTRNWDYNVKLMKDISFERNFIKTSASDPTFLRPAMQSSLPHTSESFSYDQRIIPEQRDHYSLKVKDIPNFENSDTCSKYGNAQIGITANLMQNSQSTYMSSKYGYGRRNQFLSSKVLCLHNNNETAKTLGDSTSGSDVPKSNAVKTGLQNTSLTSAVEEYEHFLKTPTIAGQISPLPSETTHFNEMPLFDYKMPEDIISSFHSRGLPDPESELDNDDQMSVDFDESLGILTPSQMKDCTLCPELRTSCSDIRAMDFPSSESFDDINDLPEDEQVHDVSVKYLSESTSLSRMLEISKQNVSYAKKMNMISEDNVSENMVSSTDRFLFSISQKDLHELNIDSSYDSKTGFGDSSNFTSTLGNERTQKVNNTAEMNVLSTAKSENRDEVVTDNINFSLNSFTNSPSEKSITNSTRCASDQDSEASFAICSRKNSLQNKPEFLQDVPNAHNLSDNNKIKIIALKQQCEEEEVCRKSYDTDSSRDSLLPAEPENSCVLKEKPTVSWEDCVSQRDSLFTSVERPESVYTVASSDTGYQEDGELEGETGMATSMDSTDGTKRFSTASRDSCIITEDVDVYKIAESNSTSGYSTGLSDSCCNDRPEDDISNKPLTDEEIQDSVGPCDSEEAFSFQESISKDTEILNAEISDVTAETVTALCHDSTSEALCEAMVEDTTLTEIHDLLLSPEENQSEGALEDNDNEDIEMEPPKAALSEANSTKANEKSDTSISAASSTKSTPEKKLNRNRTKVDMQRNQKALLNKTDKMSMLEVEDADKKKQLTKSPKKNVMSKIKAMIEATSCKTMNRNKPETIEPVNRRVPSVPKKSRWEAVTSKIAASLAEEKVKPKTKREIKSRVDTNLALARQQVTTCKSPKLDAAHLSNRRDRSMSPMSMSSRDRKTSERNSAPNSVRGSRTNQSRESNQGRPKSPRPGKPCITSRSTSPVAASESSTTSASITSRNSRSKIAHWKGSTSTIASSAPPPPVCLKKQTAKPQTKAPVPNARITSSRTVIKKPPTAPKIRISLASNSSSQVRSVSPSVASPKAERKFRQSGSNKEQSNSRGAHHPGTKPVRPPMWLSKAELTQEIQRLGNLCESRTKELNRLKMETKHVAVGFDAFAALFKYMVDDLNALSVPKLSEDLKKTLKQLELTKQDLAYYEREVEEMKAHHCQELNDLSNKLFEVYQGEVAELNAKHQEAVNLLTLTHQEQLENLTATFNVSSEDIKLQQEKLVTSLRQELITQKEEMQLFQEQEIKDLEDKHLQSSKMLHEHIEQLKKKCAELKQHSMNMEDALRKDTDTKLQWVAERKIDLEKEVESLKAVLEMKNKELHTLRVQNLEMEKQLEELPLAREKIKMLQARAEDLEALTEEKTKLERKLSTENHEIKAVYEKEFKVNKRLSMENEELQWRLRQAEHSLISGSFLEVAECEENEDKATSPLKSPAPQSLSRSVFFTFMDKDDSFLQSPRSQYKKIMPGFSSQYKTSPGKKVRTPPVLSPRKAKSHSEPPQLPLEVFSTPRKVSKQPSTKQKGNQKRQRSRSDCVESSEHNEINFQSVTESMASSLSSESSVFEHKERHLEENNDQIIASLEILREQRSAESPAEMMTPTIPEKMWCSDGMIRIESSNFETEDMSRSAEFADPKTYYHMTFPVLKETGAADCETEENCKISRANSPIKEGETENVHSTPESNISIMKDGKNNTNALHTTSNDPSTSLSGASNNINEKHTNGALCNTALSNTEVQNTESNTFCKAQDRWRTI